MREIKFKAWDIQKKGMNTNNHNVIVNVGSFGAHGEFYRHVVRQYTGLNRKNGKETYKNGILMIEDFDRDY